MAADYTSSVYSLVVIVSATLALSSYLLTNATSKLTAAKARLEDEWKTQCGQLATGETSDEALKSEYDRIANQTPIGVELHVAILVALLPASAVLQILNVAVKAWGEHPVSWAAEPLMLVAWWLPYLVILSYVVAIVIVSLVVVKIRTFRKLNEDMKDAIDSLVKQGIMAVSHYEKGLKKNGATSSTLGSGTPPPPAVGT